MGKVHIVEQGEHLSGIAAQYGFRDFHTVWNHPDNATVRGLRDPHVLFPGDQVSIPDLVEKAVPAATGAVHLFLVPTSRLHLRLKVLDLDNRAVAGVPGFVKLGSQGPFPMDTDGDGIALHQHLEPSIEEGRFELTPPPDKDGSASDPLRYNLRIGHLNPVKKLSGQQARLNNLGYFAGFDLDNLEQLLWAAEEFQCDHVNAGKAAVKKRPDIVAVVPSAQNQGREAGSPAVQTGIQDDSIRSSLIKFHGV